MRDQWAENLSNRLTRWARARGVDEADAADLVQTVHLELASRYASRPKREQMRIAYGIAGRWLAMRGRERARARRPVSAKEPAPSDPRVIAEESESRKRVYAAMLARLSDAEREILRRRLVLKQPFGAIAEELGITEDAARQKWVRALEKLRGAAE